MVMSIVAWPSSSWTTLSGTPRMARCDAKLCRSTCQLMRRSPARWQARHSGHLHSVLHQHLTVLIAEHERTEKMPLLFERCESVITQRNITTLAALRLG